MNFLLLEFPAPTPLLFILQDVPFYTLPLNKFRELFQARFKASISVLELYKMVDVCHIRTDETEEKHIHLNQAFLAKIVRNVTWTPSSNTTPIH